MTTCTTPIDETQCTTGAATDENDSRVSSISQACSMRVDSGMRAAEVPDPEPSPNRCSSVSFFLVSAVWTRSNAFEGAEFKDDRLVPHIHPGVGRPPVWSLQNTTLLNVRLPCDVAALRSSSCWW